MNETAARYRTADRPLTDLLERLPKSAWSAPSPCEGWTASDIVAHLVDTQRDFLLKHGADLGEPPAAGADPAEVWRTHAGRVASALADDGLVSTPFDGFFGPTSVGETLTRFYVWDMLVHRWDVARAAGMDAGLTDDELDRIEAGADGFGEALHMDGICGPEVQPAAVAGRAGRVLARLGRRA